MPEATPHPALPRKGGGDSGTRSSSPSPLAGPSTNAQEGRGGGLTPTAKQRALIALANTLGRENFAPRAARYDRDASFPFENYADLKSAKLTALCIPESEGGLGADFRTYCLVSAELGRWCGSTALTFNMHVSSTLWTGPLADDLDMTKEQRLRHAAHRAAHYRRIVEDGAIYAQPFSEGGASAAGKAPFGTVAKPVAGGYVLNGKKIFASLSGAADYYGVLCTEEKPVLSRADTLYLAVPGNAEKLRAYAEKNGYDYFEISAVVGDNVRELVRKLARFVRENREVPELHDAEEAAILEHPAI